MRETRNCFGVREPVFRAGSCVKGGRRREPARASNQLVRFAMRSGRFTGTLPRSPGARSAMSAQTDRVTRSAILIYFAACERAVQVPIRFLQQPLAPAATTK